MIVMIHAQGMAQGPTRKLQTTLDTGDVGKVSHQPICSSRWWNYGIMFLMTVSWCYARDMVDDFRRLDGIMQFKDEIMSV